MGQFVGIICHCETKASLKRTPTYKQILCQITLLQDVDVRAV